MITGTDDMGSRPQRVLHSAVVDSGNGSGNGDSSIRRFGAFEVDLRAGELRRNGIRVKLQEQPFQALTRLLERPGELVSRDELHTRLWPADTFVDFDQSLNAAIKRLRDALGDSAENPRFVETVARRGYRFVAPVQVAGNGSAVTVLPALPEASRGRHRLWWLVTGGASVLIVLFLGLYVGCWLGRKSTWPVRISQLTANPADDRVRTSALSRDGKYLAFSDENGFYLRQVDTGETHAVNLPEGLAVTSASWHPDGAHIVVALIAASEKRSLWSIPVLGGPPRALHDDGFGPSVSPDGTQVAFLKGTKMRQQVWVMDADGAAPRKLVGEGGDFFGGLAWSPDGAHLAYVRGRFINAYGVKGGIEVVDLAQTRVRSLLSPLGLDAPLVWTSDGRLIYVVTEPPPHQTDANLWSVRMNSRGEMDGSPARLTAQGGLVFEISASSDGKRLAYLRGVPQPDVYVADVDGASHLGEPQRLTLDDHEDFPYDWTPDGKAVIFISNRTGTFNIYKQTIDQNVPELLVSGKDTVSIPRLNVDGTQILYLVYPPLGETRATIPLMRVPLAGGPPELVLETKGLSNHQCARGVSAVCVYSDVDPGQVTFFTFDPFKGKGAQVYQIKDELPGLYDWSLSPDGRMLAVAKGKWGETEESPRIRLVTLKDGAERWLDLKGIPGLSTLDWAADGKSLWAATSGDEGNALLNIDLRGGVREVWRPKKMNAGWAIPSRDGRHVALRVGSASANVGMLENF